MKAMLSAYHHAVTATYKTRTEVPTHENILPLIETQWDQDAPYSNMCPNKYPTGCVATVMAQIMYYHKYPNTFDWDAMKTSYKSTDTGDAADAVAKLMADIGEKVFMKYSANESSASLNDISEALRYDYGYSETTEYVRRDCYTAQSWDELLYNELAASRPVIFGAQSMTPTGQGGHAFVIDGYEAKDGVGYFHVNWGWGGRSDDYFLISVLNPDYQYTGGNAGSSGFSINQIAIIGIQPAETPLEKTTRFATQYCYIKDDESVYTRSSTSDDFSPIKVYYNVWNIVKPEESRQFDIGIALYKDRELKKILDWGHLKDIYPGGKPLGYQKIFEAESDPVSIGKDLPNGKYQIRVISRLTDTDDWTWAIMSACRYVELTIEDNTMTTATYGNSEEYESENDFTIHTVEVTGSEKVGEPLTIKINLTNNHMPDNSPIFLWGNASLEQGTDSYQCLGGGGSNLSPGETGDLVLEYTPQRAGDFKFILTGSSANCKTSLYTFDVSVTGMYLVMELAVEKSTPQPDKTNKVDGTTLEGTVTLSNYGSEAYDDKVYVRLWGFDDNDHDKNVGYSTQIALGEKADVKFSFTDLTPDNRYLLLVTAMDGEKQIPLNYIKNEDNTITYYYKYVYRMTESSGLQSIKLDQADAEVYDIRGVRQGKASDIKSLPKGVYIINKKKVINN